MSAVPALSAIASRQPCASKSAWAGFVVVSALLVAGSVYRAATYPLVHDEALSFAIFTWEPQWAGTANHHRLNTWAMEASARWFGVSELTLRLPNVLAHVVYLGCVLALLRRLGSVAVQVCAFAAWALNPFVLDFFALARGYGLGLAAMAASLALLARGAWLGALATAAVAVLAHFSFFLFYVALHPVVALWGWRQERSARAMLAAGGLSAAFAGWIVTRVGALQARHELYFGGTQGFLADTVGRLIECTLYAVAYPEALRTVAPFAVVGVLAGVVGVGMWVAIRRRDPVVVAMGALLAGMVALPIAARACGASLFPIERAALGYVPVAAAALAFALAAIVQRWPERGLRGAVLALGALGAAHFAAAYDVFSCRTWAAEANHKRALALVAQEHRARGAAGPVTLATSWVFRPSLTFYRVLGRGSWLAAVTDVRLARGDEEYAYVLEPDAARLAAARYTVLARFDDTHTVLLRRID